VDANCPWFGSKLNGTLMSFVSGLFVDCGIDRAAAGAACRSLSREAADARGQPIPKEIEIIVSAVIARSARARGAIEDRSLVILVVPLCPPGMSQAFISQDFRFGLLASIKNNTNGAVYLIYFYPEGLQRPTNGQLWLSGSARTWKYLISNNLLEECVAACTGGPA
jgi:hypothetical protein